MIQPEALRLADLLERDAANCQQRVDAAAELRRLHQFAEDQIGRATAAEAALQMTKATHALKIAAVEAQRDALLEALQDLCDTLGECGMTEKARAAIVKAEGEKE